MKAWTFSRLIAVLGAALLLWVLLSGLCLLIGSTGRFGIPSREQFAWRLEAVLLASLVGAALSAAGVVYQTLLRNPLADPYLLGVSSGASLLAYVWRFEWAAGLLGWVSTSGQVLGQQLFAFIGAVGSVAVVFALASRRGRLEPVTLLLVGVIVNAVNGSLFLLLNALGREMPASGGALAFLVGQIQTTLTAAEKSAAAAIIALSWLILMYSSGRLAVAGLSDGEAASLGISVQRLRWAGLGLGSLMTASAVAISGPIGFIGLVCPHLSRLLVGSDPRRLLPVATGLGAGLLALADAATRYLAGERQVQTLLPVGVLTGLLGGPFFLMLLWQNRRRIDREASA